MQRKLFFRKLNKLLAKNKKLLPTQRLVAKLEKYDLYGLLKRWQLGGCIQGSVPEGRSVTTGVHHRGVLMTQTQQWSASSASL